MIKKSTQKLRKKKEEDMRNGGGYYTEMAMVTMGLILGMSMILLFPIMPSSAQPDHKPEKMPPCWKKIMECIGTNMNPSPETGPAGCCPLIEQQSQMNNKGCFCSISQDPNQGFRANGLLANCHLPPLDAICSAGRGVPLGLPTAPASDSMPSSLPSPPTADSVPSKSANSSDASSRSPPSPPSPTPMPSPTTSTTSGNIKVIVTAIVVPSSIMVVLLLAIFTSLYSKKENKNPDTENSQNGAAMKYVLLNKLENPSSRSVDVSMHSVITAESLQYELETLKNATDNFADERKIGRGGFGIVYKGTLENGQEIAVKRLINSSGQGDKEFKTEVELLATLRHRNLVKLLGFCLAADEKLLVYEFVPNKSLDYFLFDSQKAGLLNWAQRYNIIRGIARGMLYLHEDSPIRIIHRDLKAANVLLDMEMNPKISDFGTARISKFDETHISTSRVAGTFGYMAPEYLMYGQMSIKSDVYSFGVMVLEMISGRRISETINQSGVSENLLSFAWRCWEDGKPLEFMDAKLTDSYSEDEVIRCLHQGLLCAQEDVTLRPTMSRIVHMLDSYSNTAPPSMPQRPAYMSGGNIDQLTLTVTSSTSKTWSQTSALDNGPNPR